MSGFVIGTLPIHGDERGSLVVLEQQLPFPIRRVYWINATPGLTRGGHRHRETRQALVAVTGTVEIDLMDANHIATVRLADPATYLLVEPEDWHEMRFSEGACLLVMASHPYDAADYIHEAYPSVTCK